DDDRAVVGQGLLEPDLPLGTGAATPARAKPARAGVAAGQAAGFLPTPAPTAWVLAGGVGRRGLSGSVASRWQSTARGQAGARMVRAARMALMSLRDRQGTLPVPVASKRVLSPASAVDTSDGTPSSVTWETAT